MIGTSIRNLKDRGSNYRNWTGPVGDPTKLMDFMDRIAFDVKKNGAGYYKIIASNSDLEFEYFEIKVKVVYEP